VYIFHPEPEINWWSFLEATVCSIGLVRFKNAQQEVVSKTVTKQNQVLGGRYKREETAPSAVISQLNLCLFNITKHLF